MSAAVFLGNIIHGRSHPFILVPVRTLLLPLSLCYAAAAALRNMLYDFHILKQRVLPVPVISVGNITVGGTGKTPAAVMLLEYFRKKGRKIALLARNYGAEGQELNDELSMIRKQFPDIIIVPGRDRAASGLKAVEQGAELIILDDGFQHRKLHRNCNILTIDSRTEPGFHFPLPAGPFREMRAGRKRADIILMTKCADDAAEKTGQDTESAPSHVFYSKHTPACLRTRSGDKKSEFLDGKDVFLFCGIGDPGYFSETVSGCGADIKGHRFFPDHHTYTRKDIEAVIRDAEACNAEIIVCTEKDMVKAVPLFKNSKNNIEFSALSITIEILDNEKLFWDTVHECVAQ